VRRGWRVMDRWGTSQEIRGLRAFLGCAAQPAL